MPVSTTAPPSTQSRLESALKEEATRRRLPVSQLVRNILEDTLTIVGDVVDGVDAIVQDSIKLGRNVGQSVARVRAGSEPAPAGKPSASATAEAAADAGTPDETSDDLTDVFAWNEVVLYRDAVCSRCGTALRAGQSAVRLHRAARSAVAVTPRSRRCPGLRRRRRRPGTRARGGCA